jgi:hypothetical protein
MNYRLRFMETRCLFQGCDLGERRVDFVELQQLAKIYNKDLCFFAIEYEACGSPKLWPTLKSIT